MIPVVMTRSAEASAEKGSPSGDEAEFQGLNLADELTFVPGNFLESFPRQPSLPRSAAAIS
jgi:hypothetical protein